MSFASATIPGGCEDSMVAYWKMDGDVTDSYINGYDGSGGFFDGTSLKVDTAAKFRGSDKITVSNLPVSYFASAFTIEMWIKEDGMESSALLFDKDNYKIEYVLEGSFPSINHYVRASVGSVSVSSDSLNTKDAYHIALTWDTSNLKLYVNGDNVNSTTLSSAAGATRDLIIGDGFTGLIDELAIYSTVGTSSGALSSSIIGAHYELGKAGKDYCDEGGAGGTSRTETSINIDGCNFDFDGGTFGVARNTCSVDPVKGLFFCTQDGESLITADWGLGCAMGDAGFAGGNDSCCPLGKFCNVSDDGKQFRCVTRPERCVDQNTSEECADMGCFWWCDKKCYDKNELTCGDYASCGEESSAKCDADDFNLGKYEGVCGTIVECGDDTIFSISDEGCGCAWYDDTSPGHCDFNFYVNQMFYGIDETPNKFSCSNSYILGECVDGVQEVNWSSNSSALSGDFESTGIPQDCLAAVDCDGGEEERQCGEPIIKLPGFSLFAFFMSLFLVGIYCIKNSKSS